MTTIDPAMRLGDLVLEEPGRARLLERLRLDFCCGGTQTLTEACTERGLDVAMIVEVIEAWGDGGASAAGSPHDVGRISVAELCDHIVHEHHDRLRRELPEIGERMATVVRVHGDLRDELHDVQRLFDRLRADLERHIEVEESTLFPLCRASEVDGAERVDDALLTAHEDDHADVGEALVALRELCGDYDAGGALCSTHRALLASLHDLEVDLHQHVHEENNVLFPRVRALVAG